MTGDNVSRLSRRKVIAGLGLGAAAAGAMAAPPLPLSWTRKPGESGSWWDRQFTSLAHAGFDQWSSRIGSEFRLGNAIGTLKEVSLLPSKGERPPEVRDRAFALVFESQAPLPPGDRILDVSHAQGGDMKIYFSECGAGCGGRWLQAVFG